MSDMVNHPPHYQGADGIEAIDVIEAYDLGYHLGNAFKYFVRAGKKGSEIEDLKKARWYLARWINLRKAHYPRRSSRDELNEVPLPVDVVQAFGLIGKRAAAVYVLLAAAGLSLYSGCRSDCFYMVQEAKAELDLEIARLEAEAYRQTDIEVAQ